MQVNPATQSRLNKQGSPTQALENLSSMWEFPDSSLNRVNLCREKCGTFLKGPKHLLQEFVYFRETTMEEIK